MERTITLSDAEQICISVMAFEYLKVWAERTTKESERQYHRDSNIAVTIRVNNKIKNLRHGSHVNYDLDRLPVFMQNIGGFKMID